MEIRFASRESGARTRRLLDGVVIGLWVTVLVIICCRVALFYPQHDVFVTYVGAGRKWIKSEALYSTTRGFVYSPLIAGCFAAFSWLPDGGGCARQTRLKRRNSLLACPLLAVIGFYLLLSFQHTSEANWPAAAYVGGLILVAAKWDYLFISGQHWKRRLALAAIAVATLETAVLHETSWLRLAHRMDPLNRARGWRDLAEKVVALQRSTGTQFVIANKYMTASLLSFYLPGRPAVFMPVSSPPYNQLVLWPGYRQEHSSGDALFVSDVDRTPLSLTQNFYKDEPLGPIDSEEGGRKVSRFYLFVCQRGPSKSHTAGEG
jgi:hypothetical protein